MGPGGCQGFDEGSEGKYQGERDNQYQGEGDVLRSGGGAFDLLEARLKIDTRELYWTPRGVLRRYGGIGKRITLI